MNRPLYYRKFGMIYDLFDYPFEIVYYRHMRNFWLTGFRNQTILEIGVGTGKNLQYYHESNTVVAIDRERSMIDQARRRLNGKRQTENILLKLQTKGDWQLKTDSFTTVIATFVFCTMENPKPVLNQLLKWTKTGAKLIIFEFLSPSPIESRLSLKLINPIANSLFGVNFYRKPTYSFLDGNWKLVKTTTIVPNLIVVHEIFRI